MSDLARQLIAENKQQYLAGNIEVAKFLDLGRCGLKNELPEELFELSVSQISC